MTDDKDAELVAFIDGRLDEVAREAVAAELARNPELRARYEQFAAGTLPFRAAFAAGLDEAPVARMQARLDAIFGANGAVARWTPLWTGAVAAGLALFVVAWAIGRYVPIGPSPPPSLVSSDSDRNRDDWREAVADYIALYSAETLTMVPSGGEGALPILSERLGLTLSPASVALPDMTFKRAQMLSYEGAPLGQIAYLDEANRPAAFCIIRNGETDAPVTTVQRDGLAVASWAQGGRGYIVLGHFSAQRARELAETIATRF
jgi:anti-sigma factor RsiW